MISTGDLAWAAGKKAVLNHPIDWLSHKLAVFKYIIGFNHDPQVSPVFMYFDASRFSKDVIVDTYSSQHPPQLTKLQH
jgi:hypothetical protein